MARLGLTCPRPLSVRFTIKGKLQSAYHTCLFVLTALLSLAGLAVGQGTPSFSAYDSHSIDTVNLQNLSVSLSIPVFSKAGAIGLTYSLQANSYIYASGGYLYPGLIANPLGVLVGSMRGVTGESAIANAKVTNEYCPNGQTQTTMYSNWYIQFADGTFHWLPTTDYSDTQGCYNKSFTDQVIDHTGYTLSVNLGQVVSIYDRSGMSLAPTQITDSNGNKIYYKSGAYVDSLGLSTLYGFGDDVHWTDVNGGSPGISPTNTAVTLQSTFGCTDGDYDAPEQVVPTAISFPDGTSLGLSYEPTPNEGSDTYTGRLQTLTLRSGGTITYKYNPENGTHDGLNCTYQVPNQMTRATSDGTTTYVWTSVNNGNGNYGNTTTVTDNGGNATVYTFTGLTSSGVAAPPVLQALTEVQHYQGAANPSNLLTTDVYCYNGLSGQPGNCPTAVVSGPITEVDVYHTINGMSTYSERQTKYDKYGNVTYSAQYDFAAANVQVTTITYGSYTTGTGCGAIGNSVNNKPCETITTLNGSTIADTRFTYESHGNLTQTSAWNGSSWIGQTSVNTYNSNGTPSTTYDLANNPTSYGYSSGNYVSCSSCTSFPFPTSITKGGLTTSSTWNGVGGVKLSDADANTPPNITSYCYNTGTTCPGGTADPFWRVMSVADPLGNEIFKTYPKASSLDTVNSSFTFNSGNSTLNTTETMDGFGRTTNVQTQAPSGSYDTVTTTYGWSGNYRIVAKSQPCTASLNGTCATVHTSYFDPLGRLYEETTTNNETIAHTYVQNDDTVALSPAPQNEHIKQVERQYDGLGRLQFSCALGNGVSTFCNSSGSGPTGLVTSYSYSAATGSTTTKATRISQSHTNVYDALGRITQKTTPEGGTWNYQYDVVSGCTGSVPGKLAKLIDPNGNSICYAYDSLGRVTKVNANGTTCRLFYYDSSTGFSGSIPSGISIQNSQGRVVEAATSNCLTTLLTDIWFSYDKDGHVTGQWESTPNSTQYYHSNATYYGNGTINTLTLASPYIFSSSYGLDGEGRLSSLVTSETANGHLHIVGLGTQVSSTQYNAASQPTNIAIGTGQPQDNDQYTYDANTGRMTQWTFQVGSSPTTETGALQWNPNGTLNNLQITDGFNPGAIGTNGGTQTCYYNPSTGSTMGYDDWGRLLNVGCVATNNNNNSTWSQTFSYDQYDNITKTTPSPGVGWSPGYTSNNQYATIGATYDSNGNLTYDSFNHYAYNEFSKLASINASGTNCSSAGQCVVYDAFGRVVEIDSGSTNTEIWYTQLGKTAFMAGSTYSYSYWPTPGGGTLLDLTQGYQFLHKDWLGNARLVSDVSAQTWTTDQAFAPYGEIYNTFYTSGSATSENMFTGDTQDILANGNCCFDTPNRELSANQGRWFSPDPAGAGWNQYAYSTNPNSLVDPSGLAPFKFYCSIDSDCMANPWGGGGAGGYNEFDAIQGGLTPFESYQQQVEGAFAGVVYEQVGSTGSTVGADSSGTPALCFCADDTTSGAMNGWLSAFPDLGDGTATLPVWAPCPDCQAGCTGAGIPCRMSQSVEIIPAESGGTSYQYTIYDVEGTVVANVTSVYEYFADTTGTPPTPGQNWKQGNPGNYGTVANGQFDDNLGGCCYTATQSFSAVVGGVNYVISTGAYMSVGNINGMPISTSIPTNPYNP